MINESYIDKIRSEKVEKEDLKKRWGGYSSSEVEEYVKKLKKQVRDTELVFQERHEDLRNSLLAMTRERDELLEKVSTIDTPPEEPKINLEKLLEDEGLVAVPQDVFEKLKGVGTESREKLEKLEYALSQTKKQYQKLLVQHQMTQDANQKLNKEKELIEDEVFASQRSSIAEKDSIIGHYQNIQKNQQVALKKLKDIFITSVHCLESLIDLDEKDLFQDIEEHFK